MELRRWCSKYVGLQSDKKLKRSASLKGGYGNEGYAIVELEDSILTFGGYWKNGTCSEYVFQFKVKVVSKIHSMSQRL